MNQTNTMDDAASATPSMKTAIVLLDSLQQWQHLNVAAFTISGVASEPGAVGEPYLDASGQTYLPMFKDPVLVFGASSDLLVRTAERARSRQVAISIFTEDLFATFNDEDNRAAVRAVTTESLRLVGLAFRCERKIADKILKGLKLLS